MKRLTEKIFREEFKKYFAKMSAEKEVLQDLEHPYGVELPVFPEYKKEREKGKEDRYLHNGDSTGWLMSDYLRDLDKLIPHMIKNKYSTEMILGLLPRDFSSKIVARLG
jgi:hypothetical protein